MLDTPDEAVSRRLESRPDVLVLESPFPSELRSLGDGWPPLVVLTDSGEQESLGDAASITGAVVLTKNASSAELSLAIRRALELGKRDVSGALTTRQRQVLALLAAGLDNAQIAARLGISTRTARAHVSGVLERLGVDNRTQAAVMAVTGEDELLAARTRVHAGRRYQDQATSQTPHSERNGAGCERWASNGSKAPGSTQCTSGRNDADRNP